MVGNCGVLALQGAFAKHAQALERCGVTPIFVRTPEELAKCERLIIPGGESTTMFRLIEESSLEESLLHFGKPIFGTCAGMILLAHFGLLDITLSRNAYGRQVHSFTAPLDVYFPHKSLTLNGIFIRAPRIKTIASPNVKVFATYKGDPVFVQEEKIFGTTFHPELTERQEILSYFLSSTESTS